MNILDTLNDEALFGPLFKGPTWKPWKAFLGSMFGLPLDDAEMALYQHHTGRTTPSTQAFREAALVVGRRGGKSRVLALLAVYLAAFQDYRDRLAPGEAATCAVIAADRRQARSVMRFMVGMFEAVPLLSKMIVGQTNESLTLSNGVVIEIHTASFRVTRGYSLIAAICDEIAFWRSEDSSANPAEEILRALRPGLSNLGGLLLLASSPYDKRGPLYSAFRRHWGQDGAPVLVWRGKSLEMNPSLDPSVVERAMEEDSVAAASEYGDEFRNDIDAFVSREAVDACIAPGRLELPYASGIRYMAFVDPSGGSSDSFTLAIGHKDKDRVVIDCVRERRPPFSPEAVTIEFADTLKSYKLTRVTGDRYGGEWPRERFREHGITYALAEKPKSDLYGDMLPLLNSGKVELLDLPRLTAQLCGLERRTARSGKDSIDHAPGAKDDLCNSVAGVAHLCKGRPPMRIDPAELARISAPDRPGWRHSNPEFYRI